jgi:cytochrome c2
MKKVIVVLVVLLMGALMVLPVMAGGWAVVTLETLPADVVAETPFMVEFTVRQHGQSLTGGLTPQITAVHPETGESVTVQAEAGQQTGHYSAVITLPSSGQWRWHINAFGADQPMPDITVQPVAVSSPAPVAPVRWPLPARRPLPAVAIAGWAAAAGFFLVWWRTRTRTALALGLVTAVIGAAALVSLIQQPAETAVAQSAPEIMPLVEQGEALFVAKGCVMCHLNERSIALKAPHIGPDLTSYQGSPEFLYSWLADPSAMKKATQMPDLQLHDEEIEALIAFLTVETAVSTSRSTGVTP